MEAKKGDINDYVLVVDVTDNGQLYYYTGYYSLYGGDKIPIPANTQDYAKALKIAYKDEAELLCETINRITEFSSPFRYHVEEHAYFQNIKTDA